MIQVYLIVCPLVFLAGFVDSIAGGGGLISLPAYMLAGVPVHFAIGTNKLSSGMGTTMSVARLAKRGQIPWKHAAGCIIAAVAGSACGAKLSLMVQDTLFKKLMLVILPIAAICVLKNRFSDDETSEKGSVAAGILIALLVGAYDGFYGPGTGSFLILLLTGLARYRLSEANGIAKSINLTTNLTSLTIFFMNGTVLLPLGLTAGACSIAGNYIGINFFRARGAKIVRPVMLIVLGIFFIRLVTELLAQ